MKSFTVSRASRRGLTTTHPAPGHHLGQPGSVGQWSGLLVRMLHLGFIKDPLWDHVGGPGGRRRQAGPRFMKHDFPEVPGAGMV